MTIKIVATYDPQPLLTSCAICGRGAGGRHSPPVRFILMDGGEELGDVCERCAFGSTDLWRLALSEYAARLEARAAILRELSSRVADGEPAPEGIIEDILRENARNSPPRPPFLGGRGSD
ncbi:MAG: hypothetical protein Kow00124_01730 [Anaerolineae bacterium]